MIVHSDKLRWLAWLRVKMLTRNFRRRPTTLIFTIIGMLVMLFFAGILGIALFFGFITLPMIPSTELLYLLFSGLLIFWLVLPVLSYSTNEGLDITKLQLFPLTRSEVMFSLVFSSLFDIWTVFLLILFGVTIAAWLIKSLFAGLVALLVVLLFYVAIVSISQLFLALLMRTLQSRRFRDLSILIIALLSSSVYIISRILSATGTLRSFGSALNAGSFSPYLQWLPSGVAASAIRAATQGNWLLSIAMMGILLLIDILALYLWQMVLARSMTASEAGSARRVRSRREGASLPPLQAVSQASAAPVSTTSTAVGYTEPPVKARTPTRSATASYTVFEQKKAALGDQLPALVKKEALCFWRDPQLKVRVFQVGIYVLIFVIIPLFSGSQQDSGSFYANYTPFTSVAVVFLFMLTLSLNTLGIERESLTALLLFPIDRRRLLWGKNLTVFLMGLILLIVLLIVCAVASHQQDMVLPAAVIGLSGLGIALGSGNISSVYFPRYQRPIGQRGYVAGGTPAQSGGCLNSLLSFAMLIVTVLLLAPVALGIGIPFFLNMTWLWAITMPLSVIYGAVLYIILTNIASRRLLAKEPEILSRTTRE